MEIKVDWMWHTGNDPHFEVYGVTVSKRATNELVWEKRKTLHRADNGLFVRYFHSDGQPTNGFGGATFEGILKDGTSFSYKGAWSSRAGCINKLWPEDRIVDVHCGMYATAIRAESLIECWRRQRPNWGLAWVDPVEPILMAVQPDGKFKLHKNHQVISMVSR